MKKFYLTMSKSPESFHPQDKFLISEHEANYILKSLYENPKAIFMIDVEEDVHNFMQVKKRSINLQNFISLNEVEVFENVIEITKAEILGESMPEFLAMIGKYDVKDKFRTENIKPFEFDVFKSLKARDGSLFRESYKNCTVLNYEKSSVKSLQLEHLYFQYESKESFHVRSRISEGKMKHEFPAWAGGLGYYDDDKYEIAPRYEIGNVFPAQYNRILKDVETHDEAQKIVYQLINNGKNVMCAIDERCLGLVQRVKVDHVVVAEI